MRSGDRSRADGDGEVAIARTRVGRDEERNLYAPVVKVTPASLRNSYGLLPRPGLVAELGTNLDLASTLQGTCGFDPEAVMTRSIPNSLLVRAHLARGTGVAVDLHPVGETVGQRTITAETAEAVVGDRPLAAGVFNTAGLEYAACHLEANLSGGARSAVVP